MIGQFARKIQERAFVSDVSNSRNTWLALSAALLVLVFLAYLYRIDFPLYWHPDEFGKYLQLHTGHYNFRHPQLMLRLTAAVDGALSLSSAKAVIISGRIVSAISVAVACCSFAIFVRNRFGSTFGLTAGVLVAISPTVFVSGHYFKEDAVLLMSIALCMLAMQMRVGRPYLSSSVFLGIAVGAACSSKYVGGIMILPAAYILVRSRSSLLDAAIVALSAAAIFCVLNYPAFLQEGNLIGGLRSETIHVVTEHNGLTWGPFSLRTLISYWTNTSSIMLVLFPACAALSFRKLDPIDKVVLLLPFLWLATVQMSAVSFVRYVMPAIALTVVGGVWFAAKVCEVRPVSSTRLIAAIILVFAGVFSLWPTSKVLAELHDNARDRTIEWIGLNLPPDAVIATEFLAGLPTSTRLLNDPSTVRLPQKIVEPIWNVARDNTIETLRQKGFTHVVVSTSSFKRYFDPYVTLSPTRGVVDKAFYVDLFARYQPIHVEHGYLASDEVLSSDILIFDIRE